MFVVYLWRRAFGGNVVSWLVAAPPLLVVLASAGRAGRQQVGALEPEREGKGFPSQAAATWWSARDNDMCEGIPVTTV